MDNICELLINVVSASKPLKDAVQTSVLYRWRLEPKGKDVWSERSSFALRNL